MNNKMVMRGEIGRTWPRSPHVLLATARCTIPPTQGPPSALHQAVMGELTDKCTRILVVRTVPVKTITAHFHSGMSGLGGGGTFPVFRRAAAQVNGLLSMMFLLELQTPLRHTMSMGLQFSSIFTSPISRVSRL